MYEFLDRPVTSLDPGGRFLVWSMRSWIKAMSERRCPRLALRVAFSRWRMAPALPPFLEMMALFNRHGKQNFGFCPLMCNHISEHEAIIISLVCSLRDSGDARIRDTLSYLVEPDGRVELIRVLSALGQALERAEIFPSRSPLPPS